ncbi:hypothetical protein MUK42_34348 [Musa troglodytarum]|uniref:Uncharacterized protein n=1 Tax=Musa troglodytarum TaxID=320322 RepID=A0A9E7EH29_9LILI|nr:hypothetical protein MUK42_34348 [Musa troglodytarum]
MDMASRWFPVLHGLIQLWIPVVNWSFPAFMSAFTIAIVMERGAMSACDTLSMFLNTFLIRTYADDNHMG